VEGDERRRLELVRLQMVTLVARYALVEQHGSDFFGSPNFDRDALPACF